MVSGAKKYLFRHYSSLHEFELLFCLRKASCRAVSEKLQCTVLTRMRLKRLKKWALKIKSHHLIILRSNLQLANERFPCFEAMRFFSTFLPSRIALNASRILKERG